ncbi:immunoglobulin superfamily member 11 [Salmo salar]|uniref:Zgc:165604 n=1 Tax=Salmo trutta TaxID=8032 RepID=A0A673Y0G6_SALTR|nr:immunoglobulin superfamily member 11 [Salmo salar]XP_029557333.1 immunoglobulin superfamily member 11-like isoform X2 [Salmo trutta]|eukprot:XP_014051553.1 PREDICTED: immunoglobulin superfamily member 11-like [Salmo salar]
MGCAGGWLLRAVCLLSTLLEYGAVRVTMKHSNLEVVQGDSVTLPCSFFTMSPLSRLNIIWTRAPFSDPDFPTQVIVFDHGQVIENPSLTGRVGFLGIPWSADIILNNTRISDAGNYRCMVSNPPETGDPGIGELALNVLAPPSLPLCLWDGVTDTGGSVALSCMVAEGVPTPEMRWDKLEPEEISLPINMDGDLSGSVQIVNISSQNSGLYRCSVTNLLGTQNCYVNLSIYSPPASSPGILQGVLLTLSMALVLLALLVLVLWLHRSGQKRKWTEGKEEECYNEIRYTPSLIKRSFV